MVAPGCDCELRAGGGHEKVRVLNSNTLLSFGREHANAYNAVRELNRTLRGAGWTKMQDIVDAYPSATSYSTHDLEAGPRLGNVCGGACTPLRTFIKEFTRRAQ